MKKYLLALGTFLLVFVPNAVFADVAAPILDDPVITPPESATPQIIYADDNTNMNDNLTSSGFIFGNQVNVDGNIDGLAVVAGNTIVTKGEHEYGLYAGNMVTINANIAKDLFAAGNTVNISSDAVLNRDAYLAGNSIKVNVSVGRNLRAVGESLDIRGITVNGKVVAEVSELIMDENTTINGNLVYFDNTTVEGLEKATILGETTKCKTTDVTVSFKTRASTVLMSIVAGFIVMIVLFYMTNKPKETIDSEELDAKNITTRVGAGLLALIVIPFVSLIALFTGFLTPLALIVLALYVIGIYLASLITSYKVGTVISQKLLNKDNMYLALIIGTLLVKLLGLIPGVGGIVIILSLLYGLGVEYNLIKKEK